MYSVGALSLSAMYSVGALSLSAMYSVGALSLSAPSDKYEKVDKY